MKVTFSEDSSKVLFLHEDIKEYKRMNEYPAFSRQGIYFCAEAKLPVVHNLVQRLRKDFSSVKLSREIADFLNQDFKLGSIPPSFSYITEPLDFQEIALRYLYTCNGGGLLLDPGMGKSKVVLDFIALKGFSKSLIVCPKALLFVWEDEVATHRNDKSIYVVKSTSWDKEFSGISEADITVINYDKAVDMAFPLKSFGFQFIHLDEFLIKDPSTTRTKTMISLSRAIPCRCGGSGTLVNNSVFDIYAPVSYLEPSLVGSSFSKFKNRYAVLNPRNPRQVVGYKGVKDAKAILESCSIVMTKEQWLKLPEKKFFPTYIGMGEKQKEAYYNLLRNYIALVEENVVEVDNPLVMMSKLYQISNGFLYIKEDSRDGGIEEDLVREKREAEIDLLAEGVTARKPKVKRKTVFFEDAGKAPYLEELLSSKLKMRRGLIWFNMAAELEIIKKVLINLGQTFDVIKGGEKSTGDKVRAFNKDRNIQWLVCQAKSVNYGITTLGTKELIESSEEAMPCLSTEVYTQVFYSLNFSLEVFLQQQDRIHRLGQRNVCEYYLLYSRSPVETRLRQILEDKLSVRKEVLVDVAVDLLTNLAEE